MATRSEASAGSFPLKDPEEILGFGDVGRVFLDGEDSDKWHPSAGGGVWLAPLARSNTMSFTVAASDEETMFYMVFGLLF